MSYTKFFRPFVVARATPLWPNEFSLNSAYTEERLQMQTLPTAQAEKRLGTPETLGFSKK